jgi:hypothetical protein
MFITHHRRPIQAEAIATMSDATPPSHTAIVLQGSLGDFGDFTLNTIRLYQKHFPDVPVILSTWTDEKPSLIEVARREGATVILNDPPQIRGLSNINCQLVSSLNGIRQAQEIGAKYVLKTRTDQRIYAPNAIQFMESLLRLFPLRGERLQKERLIGCSLNTYKYRLYGVSDMLLFGHIDDMLLFWSTQHDTRGPESWLNHETIRDFCYFRTCEVYLVTHFLERIGVPVKWTLADSFRAYAENFCIVDRESLDLFWPKYERAIEFRGLRYDSVFANQPLTFRDWLLIYSHTLLSTPRFETILDLPFQASVPPDVFITKDSDEKASLFMH